MRDRVTDQPTLQMVELKETAMMRLGLLTVVGGGHSHPRQEVRSLFLTSFRTRSHLVLVQMTTYIEAKNVTGFCFAIGLADHFLADVLHHNQTVGAAH